MRYSVDINDEANTVLASDVSLEEAERELCRAVNEGLDAYLEETHFIALSAAKRQRRAPQP